MLKVLILKFYLYITLLLFSVQSGYSQDYIYEHFGVDEGLPSSEVYDVYQDQLGYIWFATDRGLSRYNGYEFENFTTKDGLPGNTILDFYPQEDGRVFCLEFHSKTIFYFDTVFNGFKIYPFNEAFKKHITPKSIIKSISINSNETLTLGGMLLEGFIEISNDGTVTKLYNKGSQPKIQFQEKKPLFKKKIGLLKKNNTFGSLFNDYESSDQLFTIPIKNTITSRVDVEFLNDSLYAFIDNKLGTASKSGKVTYYESDQSPTGIKRINNDTFWVGYYSNGAEIRNVFGEVLESFLPNKSVSSFLIDKEGSYWFTTIDDGIFRVKNPEVKIFTKSHISSLVKDDRSNLFTGHHNGDVSRIRNFKSTKLYKGLNDRPSFVEFNQRLSEVYGGTDSYLQNFTENKEPVYVFDARKLSEHVLDPMVNVAANGYRSIVNDSIAYYNVNMRTEDVCFNNDTIFIATPTGLFIKTDKTISPHYRSTILKSRLYDIDINRNTNLIYMASQGHGVIVYGDDIYNIDREDGITNNIVSEVHIENDSTIWACTNSGLNRINFKSDKTFSVNTITKSDGLLSNDINDVEIINDTVWVATKNGLCFFKKNMLDQKKHSNILSLNLKNVSVNNIPVNEEQLKLKYNQNSIDFTVEAVSNRNSERIEYLYRLKEIDTVWTKTKNRTISFPSLSSGNYKFEAKAEIFNNTNDLITSYQFKILPPIWKSWWFYSLCSFFVAGLVYLFFRIRVLTYNQDVFRELLRLAIKRLKRKELFYKFRTNGEDFKIPTRDILYINSQGNYLDIITKNKSYTIRCKIGDFIKSTPDTLEYLRVHRSYIIRIDQVSSKGKNWVVIKEHKIPVGETYLSQLEKIQF